METQKQLQVLRLYLLDMSKLTHRAVDYAIKGYRLGSPEFCRHAWKGESKLSDLRKKITDLCQKLNKQNQDFTSPALLHPPAFDSQVRFPLSALRICTALHAASTAAEDLARQTMTILDDVHTSSSVALEKLGFLVNRLMSLCIVALFKKESHHAESVLQNNYLSRLIEQVSRDLRNGIHQQAAILTPMEQLIAKSLKQIAGQTQEMAEAIVFWLEGTPSIVESGATATL